MLLLAWPATSSVNGTLPVCRLQKVWSTEEQDFEILSSWEFSQFTWWRQVSTAFPKNRIINISDG